MLEFLLFAFFSPSAQDYIPTYTTSETQLSTLLTPTAIPQQKAAYIAPKLLEDPKTALLAVDLDSNKTLLAKEITRPQPIASLSKLMTAYIILEHHSLGEVVTISHAATETEGAAIGLYEYERLSVGTLIEAILIPSANDAAVALAIFHSGSEEAFAQEMNKTAQKLGLTSARFINATGLDHVTISDDGTEIIEGNLLSAQDVVTLVKLLLQRDLVREIVAKDHFYGTSVNEEFFHEKPSTNQLLGTFLNVKGVKTGYTLLAGECLASLGEAEGGHEILTVILGSSDRFGETKTLLSWIYDAFEW